MGIYNANNNTILLFDLLAAYRIGGSSSEIPSGLFTGYFKHRLYTFDLQKLPDPPTTVEINR